MKPILTIRREESGFLKVKKSRKLGIKGEGKEIGVDPKRSPFGGVEKNNGGLNARTVGLFRARAKKKRKERKVEAGGQARSSPGRLGTTKLWVLSFVFHFL